MVFGWILYTYNLENFNNQWGIADISAVHEYNNRTYITILNSETMMLESLGNCSIDKDEVNEKYIIYYNIKNPNIIVGAKKICIDNVIQLFCNIPTSAGNGYLGIEPVHVGCDMNGYVDIFEN